MSNIVMATRAGTYGHFRDIGSVFEISDEKHFSKNWMVKLTSSEAKALQEAEQSQPKAALRVQDTSAVDNAELEALRVQLAEKNAEIERLTRNNTGKAAKADDKNDGGEKSAADVLKMANDPSVEFMTFKAAARKVLGDATPSTKAEIIAALEDKATAP